MEYLASAVTVASSNLSVGPSHRTRISFFLLSFLPHLPFDNENSDGASNQYLSHYIHIYYDQHS